MSGDDINDGLSESVEPDFDSAAEAWMVFEMTMENMRHTVKVKPIAYEYADRLVAERNARSLGEDSE